MNFTSHYDWLEENLPRFLACLNVDFDKTCPGIIGAHGDKGYGYKHLWSEHNIPFEHGMAILMLTYLNPWGREIEDEYRINSNFINPGKWVVDNYDNFKEYLPAVC